MLTWCGGDRRGRSFGAGSQRHIPKEAGLSVLGEDGNGEVWFSQCSHESPAASLALLTVCRVLQQL